MDGPGSTRERLRDIGLALVGVLCLLVWVWLLLFAMATAPFKFRWFASVHPTIARLVLAAGIATIGIVAAAIKRYDPKLFGQCELVGAVGMAWYALAPSPPGALGLKVLAAVFLTVKGIEDLKRKPEARRIGPRGRFAITARSSRSLPGLWHLLTMQYGVAAVILFGLLVGSLALLYDVYWGMGVIIFVFIWAYSDAARAQSCVPEADR